MKPLPRCVGGRQRTPATSPGRVRCCGCGGRPSNLASGEPLDFFSAADGDELEETLASMPLRIWRTDEVTPLAPHPNDPAPELRGPRGLLPEFLTIFTVRIPAGAAPESVDEMTEREAVRTRDLAGQGALARLWLGLQESW